MFNKDGPESIQYCILWLRSYVNRGSWLHSPASIIIIFISSSNYNCS